MEQHLSGVSSTCCSHTSAIFVFSDVHQRGGRKGRTGRTEGGDGGDGEEDGEEGWMICSQQLLLQPEAVNRQLWLCSLGQEAGEDAQTPCLVSSPWKQLFFRCVTSDTCPTVAP